MRKNAFIAIDHIAKLNECKQNTINSGDLPLSKDDLKNLFKICGIPSNSLFFSKFRSFGLLIKVEKDMYVWNNDLPIHHKTLQNVYSQYQQMVNKYANAHYSKKKKSKILENKEIEDAIYLLKENGFEIFAPNGEFYRRL